LLCLTIGLLLCLLSVTYVFTLKNNKPAHYDTDFFEAALIEAGVLPLAFGPRERRLQNPFRPGSDAIAVAARSAAPAATRKSRVAGRSAPLTVPPKATQEAPSSDNEAKRKSDELPTVPLAALERVQAELAATEEVLADAMASHEEEDVCV
jgi:hypothetical protein